MSEYIDLEMEVLEFEVEDVVAVSCVLPECAATIVVGVDGTEVVG